ncbi:hypothetical protein [Mycobacteroides abscessus]|uniref:hypothetical protein n=1 Tax=Mycobacteroides abscessus TaxID=36809 RepID=UPI0005E1CD66|nr:hypothetical protein [Mycobacteroides abscessus]CPU51241.1 Uncharacterised protein [Mycobacteroides abscessus]
MLRGNAPGRGRVLTSVRRVSETVFDGRPSRSNPLSAIMVTGSGHRGEPMTVDMQY